ncbi:MAG: DoxX family protein [Thermoanaerobaculia bacterium]
MASASSNRLEWAGTAGALVLGLVFVVAAVPKALDPLAFAEQIRFEGLDFLFPAGLMGWFVIVLEAGLGAALILDLRRRWVLVPTGLLVAFFVFLTARAYLRWMRGDLDDASACGCFGNLLDRTPAEAFWQDLVLLVPPFSLAAFVGRSRGPSKRWRLGLVGAATLGMAILAWASPSLPLDDAATRLGVGKRIVDFCAGAEKPGAERVCLDIVVPELLEGGHVVVIDDLDGEAIEETVDRLNALVAASPETSLWLLANASDERVQTFFWEWGPRFEVRETPLPLLRPLYRTLPRAFAVEDGGVTRTWAGLPDAE